MNIGRSSICSTRAFKESAESSLISFYYLLPTVLAGCLSIPQVASLRESLFPVLMHSASGLARRARSVHPPARLFGMHGTLGDNSSPLPRSLARLVSCSKLPELAG